MASGYADWKTQYDTTLYNKNQTNYKYPFIGSLVSGQAPKSAYGIKVKIDNFVYGSTDDYIGHLVLGSTSNMTASKYRTAMLSFGVDGSAIWASGFGVVLAPTGSTSITYEFLTANGFVAADLSLTGSFTTGGITEMLDGDITTAAIYLTQKTGTATGSDGGNVVVNIDKALIEGDIVMCQKYVYALLTGAGSGDTIYCNIKFRKGTTTLFTQTAQMNGKTSTALTEVVSSGFSYLITTPGSDYNFIITTIINKASAASYTIEAGGKIFGLSMININNI